MKKIIPFKKDIPFSTNISEITSISLEHNLQVENDSIEGNFIICGTYKVTDSSTTTENYNYEIPFNINLDDRYVLDKVTVDIDNFYYEVINNSLLSVNIDVLIDKIEEKKIIEKLDINLSVNDKSDKEEIEILNVDYSDPFKENVVSKNSYELNREGEKSMDIIEEHELEKKESEKLEKKDIDNDEVEKKEIDDEERMITEAEVKSLFESFDDSDSGYLTYKVYIVREGDTLDNIITKYNTSTEKLEQYNDLKDIKIGDKIIIPC